MRQLILDLIPDHPPTLENFAVGGNADALTALAAWLSAENRETCLFLWGESGAGKTHLLRACGAESADTYVDAATDPDLSTLNADMRFIAVDNVEALSGPGQISLFNHFNRLRPIGGRLIAAAEAPPLQMTQPSSTSTTRCSPATATTSGAIPDQQGRARPRRRTRHATPSSTSSTRPARWTSTSSSTSSCSRWPAIRAPISTPGTPISWKRASAR
jgi:chromosomal replication initiation ATPase DnaA